MCTQAVIYDITYRISFIKNILIRFLISYIDFEHDLLIISIFCLKCLASINTVVTIWCYGQDMNKLCIDYSKNKLNSENMMMFNDAESEGSLGEQLGSKLESSLHVSLNLHLSLHEGSLRIQLASE